MSLRQNWFRFVAVLVAAAVAGFWTARTSERNSSAWAQGASALALAPSASRYAAAIEQARAVALEAMGRGIPGMAVAVAVNGQIVWSEGFGYADLENRVPVWPTTKFRVGSVSKPLTAGALAQLVEQGKLDLDAPVQKYVPGFPDKGHKITTRLLAGHLAGIRHYKGDEFLIARRYNSVTESLAIFKDDPLLHPPGTKFSYSSYGWNLLSAVVEGASGRDFLGYMDENVFQRLGLRDTVADYNDVIVFGRTRFYGTREGKTQNAPYVDNSYKWAGGGFLSTVEDLVRFGSAHLQPGFLKQATLDLLFTSQRTADGKETGYGIGWHIITDVAGRRRFHHTGGSVGGTAMLLVYPEEKIVVAVLANLSNAPIRGPDFRRIAEAFMK
jgi:CubicO group peptidase (beta-lactamase class C family)